MFRLLETVGSDDGGSARWWAHVVDGPRGTKNGAETTVVIVRGRSGCAAADAC
jgi:hypothetical protein